MPVESEPVFRGSHVWSPQATRRRDRGDGDAGRVSQWGPFGGHVERGEELEQALRREAREELGIDVRTFRRLGKIHDPKDIEPAVIHVYTVLSWDGEPANAAPEEHTEARWFRVGELPVSEALDAYRALIPEALR